MKILLNESYVYKNHSVHDKFIDFIITRLFFYFVIIV